MASRRSSAWVALISIRFISVTFCSWTQRARKGANFGAGTTLRNGREWPMCDRTCRSSLAQQPTQGHRDGGEPMMALHRRGCGGEDADEGPWGSHGGRGQQPAPESHEEHHQHRVVSL